MDTRLLANSFYSRNQTDIREFFRARDTFADYRLTNM